MPPRLNKRQQRELEELQALQRENTIDHQDDSDDHEPEPEGNGGAKAKTFSALMLQDEIDEIEEQEEEESMAQTSGKKKTKKKKKKPSAASAALGLGDASTPGSSIPSTPLPSQSQTGPIFTTHASSNQQEEASMSREEKKSAKKARQKAAAKAAAADKGKEKEVDGIDKALEELGISLDAEHKTKGMREEDAVKTLCGLLAVQSVSLDPEVELRKFFGSKVVGSSTSSPSHKPKTHRGFALAPTPTTSSKTALTKPKSTWAPTQFRDGLLSRPLSSEEMPNWRGSSTWWIVEADMRYKGFTRWFVEVVKSGVPEGFYEILRRAPYHVESLCQMGEMFAHREEHSTVAMFLEQALWAYEKAFTSGGMNVLNGTCRLNFSVVECRGFYLALHRYLLDLLRRGCPSTAHNFTILLLSLDPYSDPHGALFNLDYTSVKAGPKGAEWLEKMFELGSAESECRGSSCWAWGVLPGWVWARALCKAVLASGKKGESDETEAKEKLLEAMRVYPEMIPLIAAKVEVYIPSELVSRDEMRITTSYDDIPGAEENKILHLMFHLYATRSGQLWKQTSHLALFTSCLAAYAKEPYTPRAHLSHPTRQRLLEVLRLTLTLQSAGLQYSIYRSILVSSQSAQKSHQVSYKLLFKYLPPDVRKLCGEGYGFDPLPPVGEGYEETSSYWRGVGLPAGVGGMGGMGMGPGAGGVGEVLERVMRGEEVGEGMMEGARHLAEIIAREMNLDAPPPGNPMEIIRMWRDQMIAAGFGNGEGGMVEPPIPAHGGGEGAIPGGLDADMQLDEDEDEVAAPPHVETDDGDDQPREEPQQQEGQGGTFIQNWFGRWWGRGGDAGGAPHGQEGSGGS